jgi:chromosome segregation ATPase
MKSLGLFTVAISAALMSSGCGYRIVRTSDVTAKRFAQDSASIATLQQQLTTLQARCRADSVRLEHDLATQHAAAAAVPLQTPQNDSLLKARTAEIATLKDQLTKVSAELDRIKRRLANPRG